jgi:TolA-binding protein
MLLKKYFDKYSFSDLQPTKIISRHFNTNFTNTQTKMYKNWKNLFVKTDEESPAPEKNDSYHPLVFPVKNTTEKTIESQPTTDFQQKSINEQLFKEISAVYEKGLDSINMPGYDFYEFYQAIASTGNNTEQAYKMAFQMAKSMDKTISAAKFLTDAEFYISKINEVHSDYVRHGQQKLAAIQDKKISEKTQLNNEVDQAVNRINQLRSEIAQLESDINERRNILAKIDEQSLPQEQTIKEKLLANDYAHKMSIDKLNIVKQSIQQFIGK